MGKVIAVTSGKGGTGKSSICTALAITFAQAGQSVLLVELDFGLRCLDLFSGLENRIVFDFGDVLDHRCEMQQAIIASEKYATLFYLPASNRPKEIKDWNALRMQCRPVFDRYDLVILDTPAGLQHSIEAVAFLADLAIVVATPDPVCIRDAAKVVSLLEQKHFSEYYMMVNRISRKNLKQGLIQNIDAMMDDIGAPLLGIVPEEPRLEKALTQGIWPMKRSVLPEVFRAVMRRIEGEYVPLVMKKL